MSTDPAFDDALAFVLDREKRFSNHANDRGGRTMYGITQSTYNAWRMRNGLPPQDVAKITPAARDEIYYELYWLPARCSDLPHKIAIAHFDGAVNMGVRQSTVLLQRALCVVDDGVIGPKTIAAAQAADEDALVRGYLANREAFVRWIAARDWTQRVFLRGWLNRIAILREELLPERHALGVPEKKYIA